MILERFSQGSSFFHKLDPRAKLISCTGLTLVTALCSDFQVATASLLLGIILTHFARLPFKDVVLRLLVVNSFTLFLWLTLPLTYPGTPMASLGPLVISGEGAMLATLITLKTNAIILFCIALLTTSTIADLGHGMQQLRLPRKLCLLLLFSYRYIFVIQQEFTRLNRAAKLRCFTPRNSLHTYRTFGYLIGMTLIKSSHRADRVGKAMALRGFEGKFYSLSEQRISATDITTTLLFLFIAGTLALSGFYL